MNYFNYFTEIEQYFQSRRETFALLSSLDWVLIENWKEQGVPLDAVLKGMDRAFSRARKRINSLAYCVPFVSEVVEELKDTSVDRPSSSIPTEETRRYLEGLAAETEKLASAVPEFAPRIRSIAESVRLVDAEKNFRDAEQTLTALEEKLLGILKIAASESDLVEIQKTVDSELAPLRSSMTAEQLTMLEQQLHRRKILERYNAPRLSLFYLM